MDQDLKSNGIPVESRDQERLLWLKFFKTKREHFMCQSSNVYLELKVRKAHVMKVNFGV